jgi:hypothetical protein
MGGITGTCGFHKSENRPTLSITPVVASWLYSGGFSLSTLGGAREARVLKWAKISSAS